MRCGFFAHGQKNRRMDKQVAANSIFHFVDTHTNILKLKANISRLGPMPSNLLEIRLFFFLKKVGMCSIELVSPGR